MEETPKPPCQSIGVDRFKGKAFCEYRITAAEKPLNAALS